MKTTIPVNQTPGILLDLQYLPSIQYFTKLVKYPVVYLEAQEHYVKGSYRNRCHIAAVNGIQRLSIPLRKGKNNQKPIRRVHIAYDEHWRGKHWNAIKSAYGNSPFFSHYYQHIRVFYFARRYEYLFDLTFDMLNYFVQLLGLDCELKLTHEYVKKPLPGIVDFREKIHPKHHFSDPCFDPVYYPQVFEDRHGFQPNLSILDLLFCCGPETGNVLKRSLVDMDKA